MDLSIPTRDDIVDEGLKALVAKGKSRGFLTYEEMNEQMHALAYFAGANSIFYGEKLLTTANPRANSDMALFARLGIEPEQRQVERAPQNPSPQFYDATA